nr:DUF3035 domain-containing protein [Sphingosinicella humi]
MRIAKIILAASAASLLLTACGAFGGGRNRPDEFAVTRAQPLVVPPDFALVPPAPGAPAPAVADSRTEALEALFGGEAPRSGVEQQIMSETNAEVSAAPGARSVAGSPDTLVVDKGTTTQTILAVPEGAGQEATVTTPQ